MPPGGAKSSKPKPSEVASETKRHYIPRIRQMENFQTYSYLYQQPLAQLSFADRPVDLSRPEFYIQIGDPVDVALDWASSLHVRVPLICAAHDKRPGGDWETGVPGCEERLCRRSTLSAALATPGPGSQVPGHYPIPNCGGVYSPGVVIFRGPHDRYEKLAELDWRTMPVCSMPPTRWPKLRQGGTKYSFDTERELLKEKLRGALRICVYNEHCHAVIPGDFGLGNGARNPPQEVAELWRDVLLYDPDLRGRIRGVAFVFDDPVLSTQQMILDEMARKSHKNGSGGGKGKGKSSSSAGPSSSSSSNGASAGGANNLSGCPSDFDIFNHVFSKDEVNRVLEQPDSRYGFGTLLAE